MLPRPVIVLARAVVLLIGGATALLVPSAPINAQEEIRPTGGRIVGGVPTYIEEHPWQVALLATRPDGTFFLWWLNHIGSLDSHSGTLPGDRRQVGEGTGQRRGNEL